MSHVEFTEREGILVTREGIVHLRHAGALREVRHAEIMGKGKDPSNPFNMWAVEFTDGTTAQIGQPIIGAALNRRMMECPMHVLFPEEAN